MTDTLNIKLPPSIINVHLPALQSIGINKTLSGSTRVTRGDNTRVTRGGNTRVTRDYTVAVYPELTILKIPDGVILVSVESE